MPPAQPHPTRQRKPHLRLIVYETIPTDPTTLISISWVFTVVGLVASYVPMRRASRVDPVTILKRRLI